MQSPGAPDRVSVIGMSTMVTAFPVSSAFQFLNPGRGIPAVAIPAAVMAWVKVGIVKLAVFKLCVFGTSILTASCVGPLSREGVTS